MNRLGSIKRHGSQAGFSLIEVLIALLVLAVGLLGLALTQTMSLRYTKSAEQRTKAATLANSILDAMRSNRTELAAYVVEESQFSGVDASGGCERSSAMNASANLQRWMCEVRESLGPDATGSIRLDGAGVQVSIRWNEATLTPLDGAGEVLVETVL